MSIAARMAYYSNPPVKTAADGLSDQYPQKDCSVILNRRNCFAHINNVIMDNGRNYVKTILLTRALPALWLQLSSFAIVLRQTVSKNT